MVAVHIRGGDKAKETRWDAHLAEFGPKAYFESAFELRAKAVAANEAAGYERWPVPTVLFLATDEPPIIKVADTVFADLLAKEVAEFPSMKSRGFRLLYDRTLLRHHSMAGFLSMNKDKSLDSAQEVITDTMLIANADYIIGTCSSTVSVVAGQMYFAKMLTRANVTQGFHAPLRFDKTPCSRRGNREFQFATFADGWTIE